MSKLTLLLLVVIASSCMCENKRFLIAEGNVTDTIFGFLTGSEIFYTQPHAKECWAIAANETLSNEIIAIVELIEKLELNMNLINQIAELITRSKGIYKKIIETTQNCGEYKKEVAITIDALTEYFSQPDYTTRMKNHLFESFLAIIMKVTAIKAASESKQYYAMGKGVGELLKLVSFWDFKNPSFN
jgi:hypothetical protein